MVDLIQGIALLSLVLLIGYLAWIVRKLERALTITVGAVQTNTDLIGEHVLDARRHNPA